MKRCIQTILWTGLAVAGLSGCDRPQPWQSLSWPAALQLRVPVSAQTLGVIVNEADPLSVQIADYYQRKRHIPLENRLAIRFPPGQTVLSVETFETLQAEIERQAPPYLQAYVLTWAAPYRVDCMAITTAFAVGFDQAYCGKGCEATQTSDYFNHGTRSPYGDLGIRPTIALAALSFADARALIDRGIAADGTAPKGTAYLVSTSDKSRNVRAESYPAITEQLANLVAIEVPETDTLANRPDVLLYTTGLAHVDQIETNTFLPGAIAEHLTSFGGQLTDSSQMSSLRWLEAGATGSYGAVVEPCNFPQKFPHTGVLLAHYLAGGTLVEAMWKSVAWPGQGIFIGEPLARPFAPKAPQ